MTNGIVEGNAIPFNSFSAKHQRNIKTISTGDQLIETTVLEERKNFSKLVISKAPASVVLAGVAAVGNTNGPTKDRNNNHQPSGDELKMINGSSSNGVVSEHSSSDEDKDANSENGSAKDPSDSASNSGKGKKKNVKGKWKPLQIETYTPRSGGERRRMDRNRDAREQRNGSQGQGLANGSKDTSSSNGNGTRTRRKESTLISTTTQEPLLNGPVLPKVSNHNGNNSSSANKSHPVAVQQPSIVTVVPVLMNPPVLPVSAPLINGMHHVNSDQTSVSTTTTESSEESRVKSASLVNGSSSVSSNVVPPTTNGPTSNGGGPRTRRNNTRMLRVPRAPIVNGNNFRHRQGSRVHYDSGNVTPLSDYENGGYFVEMAQPIPAAAAVGGYVTPFYQAYQPMPRLNPEALENCIRTQIEYYFSEENLHGDLFLRRKMDKQGYLSIPLIASFYRVQALTKDVNQIVGALKKSEKVELSDCLTKVRTRVQPDRWPLFDQRYTISGQSTTTATGSPVASNASNKNSAIEEVSENIKLSCDGTIVSNESNEVGTNSLQTDLHPNVPVFVPGQPYGYGYDGPNTAEFVPPPHPQAMLCLPTKGMASRLCRFPAIPAHYIQRFDQAYPVPLLKGPDNRRNNRIKRKQDHNSQASGSFHHHHQNVATSNPSSNKSATETSSHAPLSLNAKPDAQQLHDQQPQTQQQTAQHKQRSQQQQLQQAQQPAPQSPPKVLSYSDAIKLKEKAASVSNDSEAKNKQDAESETVVTEKSKSTSAVSSQKSNETDEMRDSKSEEPIEKTVIVNEDQNEPFESTQPISSSRPSSPQSQPVSSN